MGFQDVYEYSGGKADWIAMGLPTEGEHISDEPRIEQVARRDVPSCALTDTVAAIRQRNIEGRCVVLDPDNIVLGMVELSKNEDMSAAVEDIMDPAPLTFRPGVPVSDLREYFEAKEIPYALVTTSIGEYIGTLTRGELGL